MSTMQRLLATVIVISAVTGMHGNNPKECDINTWYSRVSSEGLFDRPMSIKQRKTHETIKNILAQGRRRLVQCHILQAFENDLKNVGNERHVETEIKGKVQNRGRPATLSKDKMESVEHTAIESNKKMIREGHATIISKEKLDYEQTLTNSNKEEENIGSSTIESQENDKDLKQSVTKENKEKLQEKEKENDQFIVQEDDDSNVDGTIHIQSPMHNNELDMNNSSGSTTKDKEISLANNSEDDETELDDEEDEERNGGDLENDDRQRDDEDNDEYSEETSIAQNSYLSSSEFDTQSKTDKSAKRNNETKNDTLPNEKTCKRFTWSFQRHLVFKTSPLEEGYTQNQRLIGHSCQASFVISPTYCGLRRRNLSESDLRQNVTIVQPNQNGLSGNEDKVSTKSITKVSTEKFNVIPNVEIEQTEKKEEKENVATSVDDRDGKAKYTTFKQRRTVLDNTLSNSQEDTMKSKENLKFQETSNIEELKLLVSSKTEEYTKKIHFLELNLIKLENQMLMEKLNKENHSSTIARLENSILRLENELLRMRQNFHHMKIDNDEMKKTQRKYLELGHTSENHSLQRQNNHDEMLLEQQKTITILSDKLQNQSDIILRLKNRSEHIDDQNRILHSLIINQTTLVSQIMAKVQALTEQSLQHQQEAKEMKEQLKNGLANVEAMKNYQGKQEKETNIDSNQLTAEDLSQQLLQQLDDLVSDKKLEGADNLHTIPLSEEGVEDEVDEQLKQYLHFASVSPLLKPEQWCDSRVHCYKGIITLSDCIPYSFVIYSICEVQSERHNYEKDDQDNIHILERRRQNDKDTLHMLEKSEQTTDKQTSKEIHVSGSSQNLLPPNPDDGSHFGQEKFENTIKSDKVNIEMKSNDTEEFAEVETKNKHVNKLMLKTKESVEENTVQNVNDINIAIKEEMGLSKETNTDIGNLNDKNIKSSFKQESIKKSYGNESGSIDYKNEEENNIIGIEGKHQTLKSEKSSMKSDDKQEIEMKPKLGRKNAAPRKPVRYASNGQSDPKDCYDYFLKGNSRNGVYKVRPYGTNRLVQVYCDMKNGGWTLIQKRQDGTTNFFRDWEDYKEGFGGVYGEHWLGNSLIHRLTNQDHYLLRIEMMDWDKNKRFAEYTKFFVDHEDEGYKLHVGGYEGDAGDGMIKHNNQKFSTRDVDNDQVVKEFGGSCAKRFHAAWWYYKCYQSNLNGKYYRNGKVDDKKFDGVAWKPWTGANYSLKEVEMKIRPISKEN